MSRKIHIPKIPHAFFKWYCKKGRYEELHGDLEEFFFERIEESGLRKARLYYLRDVIRCCQPYAWKRPKLYTNPNLIMFKNYFKTAFRSALRNPLSSFINVFGLSVAIGISVVVYAFMKNDADMDRFHEHKDEVFLTTMYADRNGTVSEYGMTPGPLAMSMQADFPNIEKVCRIKDANVVVKYGEHVFYELVRYVDPTFLEMFTFPLKWGQASSLQDVNSIILSSEMSVKYFGDVNPVGEEILVKVGEIKKPFKVTGVATPFPEAHIIGFDFLINFDNYYTTNPSFDFTNWQSYVAATLIQVDDPAALINVAVGMDKYRLLQNAVDSDWTISDFEFHSIANLHYASGDIINGISSDGLAPGRLVLPIIAVLMLLLACLSYINMAIASATRRLKEIGVRKVIGANRNRVIVQFLAENIFVTLFALIIGVGMGITLFFPWFLELSQLPMDLELLDTELWLFLLLLLVSTGLISGAYPALYISQFQAVKIFKGTVRFGKKNPLTKLFLGFQLVLACLTITGAVVFTQNTAYQASRSRGYNYESVLYAQLPGSAERAQLEAAMQGNSNVLKTASSTHHIGRGYYMKEIQQPDRKYEVVEMHVGPGYLETVGVKLKEGQFFVPGAKATTRDVVVNETLLGKLGIGDPLGHTLTMDSVNYRIAGVVEDFHAFNFGRKIRSTMFRVSDKKDHDFLTLRVNQGSEMAFYADLKAEWLRLFPETPFLGDIQQDVWGGYFEQIDVYERFNRAIAMIAVLLAGLGLYGLVSLNVSGRLKEFSIRKVMGASHKHIATNIIRQYSLLTFIALLIGAPISYVLIEAELKLLFAYAMPMNFIGITISVVLLVSVLLLVIATRVFKVSRSNPVNGLRVE